MEPKGSPAPAPAAPAASAPAPAPVEAPKPEIVPPANPASAPAATAPTPARKFAGRFETVEELEKSYDASGAEARRILQVATEAQAGLKVKDTAIAELNARIEALNLEKQLGPEIKDPTPEELAGMTPQQQAAHEISKLKRDQLKEKLETQKKTSEAAAKADAESRQQTVLSRIEHMTKSEEEYPGFGDYMKVDGEGKGPIADWMPLLPMLSGHPIAPLVLYLLAKGHESIQKDRASAAATKKSALEAAALVSASLPAASGPAGGPSPLPEPSKTTSTIDPDSDEGHNARLIGAHSWSKPILPID
jgi:hypothetical protein